jgi:Zn-dependent protease
MKHKIVIGMLSFLSGGSFDWRGWMIRIFVLLLSLSIHEYAHARMADRLGDDTARRMGRLSLNPLVHLDLFGTLMIVLGAPVAWAKPVQINPANFRRDVSVKKGMMLTAIAGPVANLFLSVIAYVIYSGLTVLAYLVHPATPMDAGGRILETLLILFASMYITNVYLAVFNLLPVPPLDGSRVMSRILPDRAYYKLLQYERYIGMGFLLLVILRPQWLTAVLHTVAFPIRWLIQTPLDALTALIINMT